MLKHLWVRLMAVLSVCLCTVSAFAAEAVPDASVVPVVVSAHPLIAILAALLPTLQRALREDVSWFATAGAGYRLAILAALTVVGTTVDQIQHGANLVNAIVAASIAGGPALVIELVHLRKGGPGAGKPASSDAAAKSAQPTPYSAPPGTKLVMLGLAFAFLVLPSCGSIPKILSIVSDVASVIAEAQSIAASVRDDEAQYFLQHPNADAQTKVEQALSALELTIAAFARASKGVTEASVGKLDAAQADFVLAWKKLQTVLRDLGVMRGNRIAASLGAAAPEVREPMLLTLKLHE